jgi:hypothetical protein
VLADFVLSEISLAVSVALPAVLSVTLRVRVPDDNAALAGRAALLSDEFRVTVSAVAFTRFQFESTALTTTLNAVPAVCVEGVPVFPVALPALAVSPGRSNWSFEKAPALTVIEALVLAVLLPSVKSVAVTVRLPVVLNVTLKVCVPATSAAFEGRLAFVSEELMATVSDTFVSGFQFESAALTITVNELPAVCELGVPLLPVALPGAATSPGTRICNFVNAPAPTGIVPVVLLLIAGCVVSAAVTVPLPAVLSVTENDRVPDERAALAGRTAFGSVALIATVSLVLTIFQLASTALTVTEKELPAV